MATDAEKLKVVSKAFQTLMRISYSLPWTVEDMINSSYRTEWEIAKSIAETEEKGYEWDADAFDEIREDYPHVNEDWRKELGWE